MVHGGHRPGPCATVPPMCSSLSVSRSDLDRRAGRPGPADSWPRAGANAGARRPTWSATSPAATRWFSHVEMLATGRDAWTRDGQSRAPAGGRLRRRTVQGGRPRRRDAGGLPAARVVHLASSARGSVVAGTGHGRRRCSRHARRAGDLRHAHRSGGHASRRRWSLPATACRCRRRAIDDFAGLDVKGKVVVYLVGSPADVPGALSAHYQSAWVRAETLRRLGAIGLISIPNPKTTDVPWERSSANRLAPAMALADASLGDSAGQQLSVTFNPAHAELLFAGSGHTFGGAAGTRREPAAVAAFRAACVGPRARRRRDARRRVAERRRPAARQRSHAGQRVRRPVGTSRSRRRRRARSTATPSTTAPWTTRRASPR